MKNSAGDTKYRLGELSGFVAKILVFKSLSIFVKWGIMIDHLLRLQPSSALIIRLKPHSVQQYKNFSRFFSGR